MTDEGMKMKSSGYRNDPRLQGALESQNGDTCMK